MEVAPKAIGWRMRRRRPRVRSGWRRHWGAIGKLADLEETGTLADLEETRLEVTLRATRMLVDPEVNRWEVFPGFTGILADPETTRLATGFRLVMEAMEFRSLRSAPETMKFGTAMEKKYYFSN